MPLETAQPTPALADPRPSPWGEVLDTLESRLFHYEQFLNGRGDVPPYELPLGLGPIPPALRARARLVLEGQLDLENRFRARMGALRTLLDRPSNPPAELSLYVDQRG
jgi:hypothetical protein